MINGLLALDTSSDSCSLALELDGACYQRFTVAAHKHTTLMTSMLSALLQAAHAELQQLKALVVSRGPAGSFTGIRLAVSFVQGLAYGLNLPIIPLSTLAALAKQWLCQELVPSAARCLLETIPQVTIGVIIDGKMHSYYYGTWLFDAVTKTLQQVNQAEAIYDATYLQNTITQNAPQILLCDFLPPTWMTALVPGSLVFTIDGHLQATYLLDLVKEDTSLNQLDLAVLNNRFQPEMAMPCYLREKHFWHAAV